MAIATAIGVGVPLAVAGAYLSAAHLWGEVPATARRLSAYAGGSVVDSVTWVKLAIVGVLLGWPTVVGRSSRGRQAADPGLPPAAATFAIVWLLVELIGVVAQRRMYAYHFLPLVPPAALLFGLTRRSSRPWPLLVGLGPVAALGLACAMRVTPTDARLPVGRYLAARAAAGDGVWADDWPRLMLETGLRPGSRQALTFLFANDDVTAAADSSQIVADLAARRPAFVILPADLPQWLDRQTHGIVELAQRPTRAAAYVAGWRRIERYTSAHYRREATVDGMAIYRRHDRSAGAVVDVGG